MIVAGQSLYHNVKGDVNGAEGGQHIVLALGAAWPSCFETTGYLIVVAAIEKLTVDCPPLYGVSSLRI